MKKLSFLFLFLLIVLKTAAQDIYFGGEGSGYAFKVNVQTVCTPLPIQSIFTGGNGSGYAFKANIQAACTPLTIQSIFTGGNGSGYSFKENIQTVCTPLVIQSIFTGGDGSGYAFKENIQAICTPLPIQSIFLGGSGNGYSFKENIQAVCTPLAIESIFFGGSGTGAAMKEGGCNTFDPPPNILSAQVLSDNLQVELTFSELIYGSATTTSSLQESDFNFTIQNGTANLLSATPSSISVSGTSVLLGIPINGNINGDEVLSISCVVSSVFDAGGNTTASVISLNLNEPKYYWVGGSGDWSNVNSHWSTSSGGNSFHTTLPNQFSTVIFDSNSFSTTGATVNMDITNVSIRSMDWSAA
ncbi:MAG: hypothetical protein DA394_09215, partial [Candidatus Arcticimaribacter sp.]